MGEIRSHKCPSCGGNLSINIEKQMYYCPFCGSTYDYEYFREEQMHELGETYLSRGEFSAAVDAYKYLLQKDPHNFLALRGTVLASARMNSMNDILKTDFRGFTYNSKLAESAVESSSAEDKDYFVEFARILREMYELSKLHKERKSLDDEKKRKNTRFDMTVADLGENHFADAKGNYHDPFVTFIFLCVVTGIFALSTIFTILYIILNAIYVGDVSPLIILAIILALITGGLAWVTFRIIYPIVQSDQALKEKLNKTSVEVGEITQKLEEIEKDIHTRESQVKRDCLLFFKEDKKRVQF